MEKKVNLSTSTIWRGMPHILTNGRFEDPFIEIDERKLPEGQYKNSTCLSSRTRHLGEWRDLRSVRLTDMNPFRREFKNFSSQKFCLFIIFLK